METEGFSTDLDVEPGWAPRSGVARVAFAVVRPEGFEFSRDALAASIAPGTSDVRYGRLWRMAKPSRAGTIIRGRIGFEREGGTAELWDDATQDFLSTRLPEGSTSPFALDLETRVVAFQLRPGSIRRRTFTAAFQALLNRASEATRWRVDDLVLRVGWDEWLSRVDRITEIRVRVERPNPRWGNRRKLRALVEQTGSELVTLAARAPADSVDGLDPTKDLLGEAVEHAEANYGERTGVGEVDMPRARRRVAWREGVEGVPIETSAETDPVTSEVRAAAMERMVQSAWAEIPFFDLQAEEMGAIRPPTAADEDRGERPPRDDERRE